MVKLVVTFDTVLSCQARPVLYQQHSEAEWAQESQIDVPGLELS